MLRRKVWEVDIDIIAPTSISGNISFKQEKGVDQDQFCSDIKLSNSQIGICFYSDCISDNGYIAKTVAFVFWGEWLMSYLLITHSTGIVGTL